MKRKKKTTIELEQVLNTMNLESVDKHAIEIAKTRVWNTLSEDIKSEKISSRKNILKINFSNFNKRIAISALSFAVFSFIAIGIFYVGIFNSNKSSINNEVSSLSDKKSFESYDSSNFSAPTTSNLWQSKNLVSDKKDFNLKVAAAAKYKEINGLSYDDVQSLNPQTDQETQLIKYNEEYAKSIQEKLADKKVSYYKLSTYFADKDALPGYYMETYSQIPTNHPKIDYSQPVITEIWYNPNYAKLNISQNGKTIIFGLFADNYRLLYAGGDYAIKTVYKDPYPLSGFISQYTYSINQDILKSILRDQFQTEYKKTGSTITLNGTPITIYSRQTERFIINSKNIEIPTGSNYTVTTGERVNLDPQITKYYVDMQNLKLYRVEQYFGDKLIQTMTVQDVKNYDDLNIKNSDEIKDIEIKDNNNIDKYLVPGTNRIKYDKMSDVVSAGKYKIYAQNFNIESFNYIDGKYYDAKFDPTSTTKNYDSRIMNYYQDDLSYSVEYAGVPRKYDGVSMNTFNKVSTIKIKVDGIDHDAQYTEVYGRYNPPGDPDIAESTWQESGPKNFRQKYIDFVESGANYRVNTFDINFDFTKFSLSTLKKEDAEKIDKINIDKENVHPDLTSFQLDQINQDKRILPGNVSKEFDYSAYSLIKAEKDGAQSSCDKFYIDSEEISNCLLEKYNGYEIDFQPTGARNARAFDNPIRFYVLDTKINEVLQYKKYLDKYLGDGRKYSIKELNGQTVIVSAKDQAIVDKVILNIGLNKDYEILKRQLELRN